jgi:hypothetical protein
MVTKGLILFTVTTSILTHPTAILLAFIPLAFILGTVIKPMYKLKPLITLGIFIMTVWLSWYIYKAEAQLLVLLQILQEAFKTHSLTEELSITGAPQHVGTYAFNVLVTYILLILQIILGLLIILVIFLRSKKLETINDQVIQHLLGWIWLVCFIPLLPLLFYHEIGSWADYGARSFILASVPLSLLITMFLEERMRRGITKIEEFFAVSVIFMVIISGLLAPLTTGYARIPIGTSSTSHMEGLKFCLLNNDKAPRIIGWNGGYLELMESVIQKPLLIHTSDTLLLTKASEIYERFYTYYKVDLGELRDHNILYNNGIVEIMGYL